MPRWIEDPSGLRFINPYSFVSLGSNVQREKPTDGELTGKIRVSLIVKTPLSIPDTEGVTTDEIDHKTYPFFRVADKPVIPGSQLRGMLRSAYETLSNSCFSVNNNNILTARHANPGNPGLIQFKNGTWHLFEARTSKDNGQTISDSTSVRRTWYSLDGRQLKTKIFRSTGIEIECTNIEKAVENYHENIQIYKADKSSFQRHEAKLTYGIRQDGKLYPVYYEIVEFNGSNYVYLSPAQMGRYVFDNRLDDLLGTHASCAKQQGESLCKACSLFGMISSEGKRSYASKLRFSDAQIESFESMGPVMLKELASPKPTAVEFYTRKPDGSLYWTYDYKITSYKRVELVRDKNGRMKTQTIPQKEKCVIVIRGRKYYLHNPHLMPSVYTATEKTKRNTTVELCKPESRFTFDIFFEKITEQQLRELLWTITIGENDENGVQMHKLGHGKPLGLGSVKLVVDEVVMRLFDSETFTYHIEHTTREQVNNMLSAVPFDTAGKPFDEFMQITRFDGLAAVMEKRKSDICYPIADDGRGSKNSKASHQWFIANRSMGENGTTTNWSVKYVLPVATSNNPTLPAMLKVYDDGGHNQGSRRLHGDNRVKPKNFRR